MRESALERKVVAHCKTLGIQCYKFSSPSRRGVPDRILLYRGRVMFIETKAPGKKPTKLQEREMSVLREAGFFCVWADNINHAKLLIDRFIEVEDVL